MYTRSSNPAGFRGDVTVDELHAWLIEMAKGYAPWDGMPYVEPNRAVAHAIIHHAELWNLDEVLAAAQIIHESAALQSLIWREKRNPAGLGASNDDPFGGAYDFTDLTDDDTKAQELGVRAALAHMATYVHGDGDWKHYDVRWSATPATWRGVVSQLWHYEQRWAWTPPTVYHQIPLEERYGAVIALIANKFAGGAPGEELPDPYGLGIPYIDIRDKLKVHEDGDPAPYGPSARRPLSGIIGLAVHYRGVEVTTIGTQYGTFESDARFHVNKNWAKPGSPPIHGDGIMYHFGCDWDGNLYLMRDLEDVLWHAGNGEWNAQGIAVQVPMGYGPPGPPPVPVAVKRSLERLDRALKAKYSDGPWLTVGHGEVGGSGCPGNLLKEFVIPYRSGESWVGDETLPPPPPPLPEQVKVETPWGQVFFVRSDFHQQAELRGGYAEIGYPLHDAPIPMVSDEGFHIEVMWTERRRLELHPTDSTSWPPWMEGRVGAELFELLTDWPFRASASHLHARFNMLGGEDF